MFLLQAICHSDSSIIECPRFSRFVDVCLSICRFFNFFGRLERSTDDRIVWFFLCPRSSAVDCLLICRLYKIEYVDTLNLFSVLFLHQHFVLGCVFVSPIHGYADTQKTVPSFFCLRLFPWKGLIWVYQRLKI